MKKTKLSEVGFFIVLAVTALTVLISIFLGLPKDQVKLAALYSLAVSTVVYLIALLLALDIDLFFDNLDD